MRSRAAQAAARSGFVDRLALLPSGEPLTFLERPPVGGGTPSSVVVFLHGMMHAHLALCARKYVRAMTEMGKKRILRMIFFLLSSCSVAVAADKDSP